MGIDENTPPTDPQAGDAREPQVGTTITPEPQAGDGKSTADYERMIAELRKEAASHRTKLKKFEDAEAERTQAQLSEQEKLTQKLTKLQEDYEAVQRSHQEYRVNTEVRLQAAQLGIVDPEVAARLLDSTAITYDEHGTPTNIPALLKELLKVKPYLGSKPAPTGGGPTSPPRSQASGESGEVTAQYVQDVLSGKIDWQTLSAQQRQMVLNWQTRNPFRF